MYDILEDIYHIDSKIEELKLQLSNLNEHKQRLMEQVKDENIEESESFILKKEVKLPNKKVDVNLLKREYPDKYDCIVKSSIKELKEKHKTELSKVGSSFSQAEVKPLFTKKEFESLLVRVGEPTITFKVRRKSMFENLPEVKDEVLENDRCIS